MRIEYIVCKICVFSKKVLTFPKGKHIILNVAGNKLAADVRLAQLDRAFGYGPKGREFESSNAHD